MNMEVRWARHRPPTRRERVWSWLHGRKWVFIGDHGSDGLIQRKTDEGWLTVAVIGAGESSVVLHDSVVGPDRVYHYRVRYTGGHWVEQSKRPRGIHWEEMDDD